MAAKHNHRGIPVRGYTLMELMVSTALGSVLMAGTVSSLYVSTQTLKTDAVAPAGRNEKQNLLGEITRDIQSAIAISELTSSAITLTVPDRTGDNVSDTLRYAWGGTPGNSLTYQFNGAASVVLATNVQNFELSRLTREIKGTSIGTVLYLSAGASLTSNEAAEVAMFKKWNWSVNVLPQTTQESEILSEAAKAQVVFVSGGCTVAGIGTKLNHLPIGIVCEQYNLAVTLGITTSVTSKTSDKIEILDNTHAITTGLTDGGVKIASKQFPLRRCNSPDATGLTNLASVSNGPSLVALEKGSTTLLKTKTQGRIVMLPWGAGAFDCNQLTSEGQTILKQSLLWAGEIAVAQEAASETAGSSSSSWFSKFLQ